MIDTLPKKINKIVLCEDLIFYSLSEIKTLPDIIRNLLNHPEQAKAIASHGYQTVMKENTWKQRAEVLIQHLNQL